MTDDKNSDHTPSCGWRDTLQHGGLSSLIEEQQLKETERERDFLRVDYIVAFHFQLSLARIDFKAAVPGGSLAL